MRKSVGIQVGVSKKTVRALGKMTIDILKQKADREVTIAALHALQNGSSVNHAMISSNSIVMGEKEE